MEIILLTQSPSFLWSHGLEKRGSTARLQIKLSGSWDENEWRSSTHPAAREKKNSGTEVKKIAVEENKTYKKIPASGIFKMYSNIKVDVFVAVKV